MKEPTPEEIADWDKKLSELRKSQFGEVLTELQAVKDHPRTLTLVTHGFLEFLVNTMIKDKCKGGKNITDDTRGYPHSTKVLLLNEMGILSDHHRRLLDWFRKLRNDFAHKWHFKLTKDRLEVHADKFREPENFYQLCIAILFDLYTTHEDIIGPALIPDAYECEKVTEKVIMVTEPGPKYIIPMKSDPKRVKRRATSGDIEDLMKALVEREKKNAAEDKDPKADQPKPEEPKT